MYPTLCGWCGQNWRYLSQDDISAVLFVYPGTSAPGRPRHRPARSQRWARRYRQVKVTWQDTASNETGFRVERSTDGVNFGTHRAAWQRTCNVPRSDDSGSASYQYRVRAFNATGTSTPSNVAFIQTPVASAKPAAPTAFLPATGATGVTSKTSNGYYLRWYVVAGATSYDVYFGTSSNPPKKATVTPPAGVSTWTIGTMYQAVTWSTKKTYYWKIVAKNAGGTTSGPIWKFTTK